MSQTKPTKIQDVFDNIADNKYSVKIGTDGQAYPDANKALSDLIIGALPDERPMPNPDYTSSDLNVSLARSITIPIDNAYNQALKDIKANLKQIGIEI